MLRIKTLASALAVACLAMAATQASADNMTVKDAAAAVKTMCTKTVSSVEHPCHLNEGSYGGVPTPIKVLSDGTIAADPSAATAALQTSANTKLDSVVSALGSPLTVTMSGSATATLQGTGNTSLSSIDTKLSSQATAALQGTGNTKLDSVITALGTLATASAQTTAAGKLDTLHTDLTAATPGGTNVIGDVGSASVSATCTTLTLPGTGGTYALGDLAANSATAGSVTPLTCTVARYSGGPVTITKARILSSNTDLTAANFRVHVYATAPTVTNGNDGVFLTTASGHFCRLDVSLDQAFSDGANGSGTPVTGATCTKVLSATADVRVLIEARGAYAWTAGQTLVVTLEGVN